MENGQNFDSNSHPAYPSFEVGDGQMVLEQDRWEHWQYFPNGMLRNTEPTQYQPNMVCQPLKLATQIPWPDQFLQAPSWPTTSLTSTAPQGNTAAAASAYTESAPINEISASVATKRRSRPTFKPDQLEVLLHEFELNPFLTTGRKKWLSDKLKLSLDQVKNWFRNRRARHLKASHVIPTTTLAPAAAAAATTVEFANVNSYIDDNNINNISSNNNNNNNTPEESSIARFLDHNDLLINVDDSFSRPAPIKESVPQDDLMTPIPTHYEY